MLISEKTTETLRRNISSRKDVFCSGLFLSARWFVFSQTVESGTHIIVLPDNESAEYCTSDLYNLIEGDNIFYLPSSGKTIEKSNYKASLEVQRTSAISRLLQGEEKLTVIVTYPEALEEKVPRKNDIKKSITILSEGQEISHEKLSETLYECGFEKVDFVSKPGQYACLLYTSPSPRDS